MAQHYQAVALQRPIPNKTNFARAKQAISQLITDARKNELEMLPEITDSNHMENEFVTMSTGCIECHIINRKTELELKENK